MKTYKHFGVMLDCSRNAVMKASELKNMIDCLQKMGYNCLQLYTEDTYEVDGEPFFGYLRGRYTSAELKEIDAYAQSKGVELIPCIQTLAHLPGIVNHEAYEQIVDCDDILLIDEPKTYELIDRMFASLANNFTSRLVNIGMDEAHKVGLGNYMKKHGFPENRFDLILRHLNKVVEIASKYGFKAHMWSDMFYRLACKGEYYAQDIPAFGEEILSKIPQDIELVYWDYYTKDKEYYDKMLAGHANFQRKIWFAGGAWTWNGFAPFNWLTLRNMKAAMQSVLKSDVEDVFITMWGDNGKECSFYSVLPSLYAIRQYANGNFNETTIKNGFFEAFHVEYEDFLLLDLPNYTERKFIGQKGQDVLENPCKSILYNDFFLGRFDYLIEKDTPIPYEEYAEKIKAASVRVGDYKYLFDFMAKLCETLAVKMKLGVKTRKAYRDADKHSLEELLKDYLEFENRLERFHESYYTLWHKENKGHGWEIQDARIGGLMQRSKTCRRRLKQYISGEIEKIEELDEEILPCWTDYYYSNNNYSTIFTLNIV